MTSSQAIGGLIFYIPGTCSLSVLPIKPPVPHTTCPSALRGMWGSQCLSLCGGQRCKVACFGASHTTGLGFNCDQGSSLKLKTKERERTGMERKETHSKKDDILIHMNVSYNEYFCYLCLKSGLYFLPFLSRACLSYSFNCYL